MSVSAKQVRSRPPFAKSPAKRRAATAVRLRDEGSLAGKSEATKQLALEDIVCGGTCMELRAGQVAHGLPGIGNCTRYGAALDGLRTGTFQRLPDFRRKAFRGVDAIESRRYGRMDA